MGVLGKGAAFARWLRRLPEGWKKQVQEEAGPELWAFCSRVPVGEEIGGRGATISSVNALQWRERANTHNGVMPTVHR